MASLRLPTAATQTDLQANSGRGWSRGCKHCKSASTCIPIAASAAAAGAPAPNEAVGGERTEVGSDGTGAGPGAVGLGDRSNISKSTWTSTRVASPAARRPPLAPTQGRMDQQRCRPSKRCGGPPRRWAARLWPLRPPHSNAGGRHQPASNLCATRGATRATPSTPRSNLIRADTAQRQKQSGHVSGAARERERPYPTMAWPHTLPPPPGRPPRRRTSRRLKQGERDGGRRRGNVGAHRDGGADRLVERRQASLHHVCRGAPRGTTRRDAIARARRRARAKGAHARGTTKLRA